jgi:hypothetical protein
LLEANPSATDVIVAGAFPDAFLNALLTVARRRHRKLTVTVDDPTKVFLTDHGPDRYRSKGIDIHVLHPIDLKAITVNPVAPQSHRFDSAQLEAQLRDAIPDVPLVDVLESASR